MFVIALVLHWIMRRSIDLYFLILSAYTLTSLCCAAYLYTSPKEFENLMLYPFIYLFIVLLIFIAPFKRIDIKLDTINIHNTCMTKALTWVVIIAGIFSLYFTIGEALETIRSGEWGALRQQLYNDEESIELYHSFFEKIVKNIVGYMHSFIVVILAYHMSRSKINKTIVTLLLIVWLLNGFFDSMLVASRGMVAGMLLEFLLVLSLFKRVISKKIMKTIPVLAFFFLIPVISYLVAVSVSRFGEEDAGSSVFYYLGHSMLTFNADMMVTMHDYAGGKYFCKYFLDMFGMDSDFNLVALGYKGGSSFYTFIGSFYIDFGPIGTFLIAVTVSVFLLTISQKKRYNLSDLMIIVYFANYILCGVFVIGKGSALGFVMLFFLCGIINFAENQYKRNIVKKMFIYKVSCRICIFNYYRQFSEFMWY